MDLSRFRVILRTLRNHGADFIVVGGIAAVLDGVPAQTLDVLGIVGNGRTFEDLTSHSPAMELEPRRLSSGSPTTSE
jgi:hypothetical protein